MPDVERNGDTWTYKVRDAAKLVALLILIGGAVANYYIVKHDLESEIQRSRAVDEINTAAITRISDSFQTHLIEAATSAERVNTIRREVRRCCRSR